MQATGAAAVGLAGVATPSVVAGGAFAHPGLLHTGIDNPHSQSRCTARPQAIVYRGVELRPRSTWPRNYGITRQPVRICVHEARHKQRPYPLIHPVCQPRSAFHISDDV